MSGLALRSVRQHIEHEREANFFYHQKKLKQIKPSIDCKKKDAISRKFNAKAAHQRLLSLRHIHDENVRLSSKLSAIYLRNPNIHDSKLDQVRTYTQVCVDKKRLNEEKRRERENEYLHHRLINTHSVIGVHDIQADQESDLKKFLQSRSRLKPKQTYVEYMASRERHMHSLVQRRKQEQKEEDDYDTSAILSHMFGMKSDDPAAANQPTQTVDQISKQFLRSLKRSQSAKKANADNWRSPNSSWKTEDYMKEILGVRRRPPSQPLASAPGPSTYVYKWGDEEGEQVVDESYAYDNEPTEEEEEAAARKLEKKLENVDIKPDELQNVNSVDEILQLLQHDIKRAAAPSGKSRTLKSSLSASALLPASKLTAPTYAPRTITTNADRDLDGRKLNSPFQAYFGAPVHAFPTTAALKQHAKNQQDVVKDEFDEEIDSIVFAKKIIQTFPELAQQVALDTPADSPHQSSSSSSSAYPLPSPPPPPGATRIPSSSIFTPVPDADDMDIVADGAAIPSSKRFHSPVHMPPLPLTSVPPEKDDDGVPHAPGATDADSEQRREMQKAGLKDWEEAVKEVDQQEQHSLQRRNSLQQSSHSQESHAPSKKSTSALKPIRGSQVSTAGGFTAPGAAGAGRPRSRASASTGLAVPPTLTVTTVDGEDDPLPDEIYLSTDLSVKDLKVLLRYPNKASNADQKQNNNNPLLHSKSAHSLPSRTKSLQHSNTQKLLAQAARVSSPTHARAASPSQVASPSHAHAQSSPSHINQGSRRVLPPITHPIQQFASHSQKQSSP